MSEGESGRFPVILYIVTPILAVVVTLLVVEGLLALFHPIPFSIERNMYFEADPHTGYRLKPNSRGYFQNGIPAVANARGHRDDSVPVEAAPSTLRILLLGDSFAVGANVGQDEAFPQVLERMLSADLDRPVEVVNTAVGGWSPYQYAQYYRYYGRRFRPDLIVVAFFVGNDAFDQEKEPADLRTAVRGRRVTREAAEKRSISLLVLLAERSHLARLLLQKGPATGDVRRETCDQFSDVYLDLQRRRVQAYRRRSEGRERAARNSVSQIASIKGLADQEGTPLLVILLPAEIQINVVLRDICVPEEERQRLDFDMPQSLLVERFEEEGIETIDLLEDFREDPRCLYMNDTHWTPEGHALAASAIRRELERHPAFLAP